MPKFYVYTLSYPPEMGGHVFYVGKGKGKRMDEHETEAARIKASGCKVDAIRMIWAAGYQVVKAKVCETDDEDEALRTEYDLLCRADPDYLTTGYCSRHARFGPHLPRKRKVTVETAERLGPYQPSHIEGRRALEYLGWLLDKRGGGLEQSEVAERMGTKQSVVSRYHAMLGTSDVPTLTISRLIRYVYLERRQELNSPPDVDLPADAPPASQDSPGQA